MVHSSVNKAHVTRTVHNGFSLLGEISQFIVSKSKKKEEKTNNRGRKKKERKEQKNNIKRKQINSTKMQDTF